MTIRAQASFDAGATRQKTNKLIQLIKSTGRGGNSDSKKIAEIIHAYRESIENMGRPRFKGEPLDHRNTATFQQLQRIFDTINTDHQSIFEDSRSLSDMITREFNRNSSLVEGLKVAMNSTTALAIRTSLSDNLVQRGQFLAVDNFSDQSNMAEESTAEVGFGGNALVLQRTSVNPVISPDTEVEVVADQSSVADVLGTPNSDYEFRGPYEGRFFSLFGEIEPEGGFLKFTESNGKLELAPTPSEDRRLARKALFDNNPDTYWQIERVVRVVGEELNPSELDEDFPYDFSAELIIDLRRPVIGTAVTLDPINFGNRNWLEITNIETSSDKQNWSQIPGLHDYNFDNVLTAEANLELNSQQANSIMSPNKYQYSGDGLWIFPEREFRYVRIQILQRSPSPSPYEILVFEQEQVVKTTKTDASFGPFGGGSSTSTDIERRDLPLTYEQSLEVIEGQRTIQGTNPEYEAEHGFSIDIPTVGNIFNAGGESVERSGFQNVGSRNERRSDAVRYAIGIRDINIMSAEYTPNANYISKPFVVPSPAKQVVFRSDATIPSSFGPGTWVKYYVSADNGTTWSRIASADNPPVYENGSRIPNTVLINSGIPQDAQDERFGYIETGSPANELKVKIELARPADQPGSTPIIKSYALEVLTEETTGEAIV